MGIPFSYVVKRFRWVYCKLDVLRQCHRNDLRRILKEPPQSLDETYQRILKEIHDVDSKQVHRILQCLVAAHRPLRVEELADVLALDVDAGGIPRFNTERRWETHETAVLSTCSSLVSVVNQDGSRVVQLCHISVKEFLMSDRLSSTGDISQYHIAREASHAILAQACLGVLLSVDDPTSEDRAGDTPLSGYAHEYWLAHARVGNVELQIKDALDRFFDLDKPHFVAFFRSSRARAPFRLRFFRASSGEESKGLLSPAAPFYFAAISGLNGLAERLIVAKTPQVLNFCGHKGTLLHLAVREGHIEAARLLLAHGADINSRNDYATPPRIASLQRYSQGLESHSEWPLDSDLGTIDTKNALPDTNVDVSSEENSDVHIGLVESRSTPLHLAASEGRLDICQMLLERNADVRVHDDCGNTALHCAVSKGHLETARLLLERGADINPQNKEGLTPLQVSQNMEEGYLDIMRLLLDHGANWNSRDNHGNTVLHFAAYKGHLETACILLERGAYVNSQNDKGLTPLQRALQGMQEGHRDVVRLLLDYGANVNIHNKSGNTALHFVASKGHLEVARILLERGADVNSQNDKGSTPLQRASQGMREGHRDFVQLLLDYGANLNARDNRGNAALHFAASEGHVDAARLLLERGADVNSQNYKGLTPLQRASQGMQEAHRDVVQLLLDCGANVNIHGKGGDTVLHFVASKGHFEVARILLERGVDINSQNKEGLTPLQQASRRMRKGYLDIMRLFLDHGANGDAFDNCGNTALHFAASKGHLETARLLLERGVDTNSQNKEG